MAKKRWKWRYNTKCILSDQTSTPLIHTPIFPHTDSQTLREADEELKRGKKKKKPTTEKGKELFLVYTSQRFAWTQMESLWRTRWIRQSHCLFEQLTINVSVNSPERRHLQVSILCTNSSWNFFIYRIPNTRNSDCREDCSFGAYSSFIKYNLKFQNRKFQIITVQ